jgi:hypothetical protein
MKRICSRIPSLVAGLLAFCSLMAHAAEKVSRIKGRVVHLEKLFRAEDPSSPPDSKTGLPKPFWNSSLEILECVTTLDGKAVAAEYTVGEVLHVYLPGELKVEPGTVISGNAPRLDQFNPVLSDIKMETADVDPKPTAPGMSFEIPTNAGLDDIDTSDAKKPSKKPATKKKK